MGDYAASGGYYISMTSDGIVAQPGTITGSIGVFGGKFNLKGFYDKIGLSKEILVRGKHAALYSEYRPWTDEERSKIRSQMVAFYKDFVSRVAEGRKKSYDEVDAIAQGRVWTGVDAKRLGLVDELGGFDVALALAKKKAGIPKDQETTIVIFPERKGLFEALMERQDEGAIAQKLPSDVRSMLRWLTLLGDGVPMARLPFELRIR
jgi:protease-4